jgi:uncharacterized SAM-binding protein YcdF (DUF218 family)
MSTPAPRRWRVLRGILAGMTIVAALWLGGLAWFVQSSLSIAPDRETVTDAIVVLTGGRLRLEAGLDLLGAGKAQKLFISGVNPRVDRVGLLRLVGPIPENDAGRIVLGHDADNTRGNARETAAWMQQEGYRSLRLVTSWYHMRRSLLEFERAMPGLVIVADPVYAAAHAEPEGWSGWVDLALLTVGEYEKYLATLVWPEFSLLWSGAHGPATVAAADNSVSALGRRQ